VPVAIENAGKEQDSLFDVRRDIVQDHFASRVEILVGAAEVFQDDLARRFDRHLHIRLIRVRIEMQMIDGLIVCNERNHQALSFPSAPRLTARVQLFAPVPGLSSVLSLQWNRLPANVTQSPRSYVFPCAYTPR